MKLSFEKAKIQILEHDLKSASQKRDEYKFQLIAANKEILALKKRISILNGTSNR
jgi:hypothetical protein